ncbi:MAG: type II toxin-antitoxin system RelE/ParE family toxin [Gemmatimonadetes bacterium]|nr:type II toxin-antitoxin system RelE/ParE family toxin [Gemmatimonadota bacterium]
MIESFRDRETERVFFRQRSRRFSGTLARSALKKLLLLDAADSIQDLRLPPGNRLERLAGDRRGQYGIRINDQWRLCFEWKSGHAANVEIVDYH